MTENRQQLEEASRVIRECRGRGIELRAEDGGTGRVLFRPKEAMPPELRERLRQHRASVVVILGAIASEAEAIAWRVAAIRPQVPMRGPIPFLVAREASQSLGEPPWCLSCGDTLAPARKVRCAACVRAIEIVLNEQREGVLPTP